MLSLSIIDGRDVAAMPLAAGCDIAFGFGGALVGAIGVVPMFCAVMPVLHGTKRAGIGRGMASIVISFGFLMVAGGIAWMVIPKCFLTFTVGMVVGYFAMLALLTALALRRS